jgi:hypothetical protein
MMEVQLAFKFLSQAQWNLYDRELKQQLIVGLKKTNHQLLLKLCSWNQCTTIEIKIPLVKIKLAHNTFKWGIDRVEDYLQVLTLQQNLFKLEVIHKINIMPAVILYI